MRSPNREHKQRNIKYFLKEPNNNSEVEKQKTEMKNSLDGLNSQFEQAEEQANVKIVQL